MAGQTLRALLLREEHDQVSANLKTEDKESLETFLPVFAQKILEMAPFKMNSLEGRSAEVEIVDGDFPQFNITPHFLVAACAMLMLDPAFEGTRLRYFERTSGWKANGITTLQSVSGVKVKW